VSNRWGLGTRVPPFLVGLLHRKGLVKCPTIIYPFQHPCFISSIKTLEDVVTVNLNTLVTLTLLSTLFLMPWPKLHTLNYSNNHGRFVNDKRTNVWKKEENKIFLCYVHCTLLAVFLLKILLRPRSCYKTLVRSPLHMIYFSLPPPSNYCFLSLFQRRLLVFAVINERK